MEFLHLSNPYDFANPVDDPNLFAGRKNALDEISYYLDHAKFALRAINLAIIGGRASGKTSVLNMIQHEAKHRGFCVVRIDLDESDSQSQLIFFHKIFDGIITTACIDGYYEGVHGQIYDNYRTIVDSYGLNGKFETCPFVFPSQYAKAMNVGNINAQLSDIAFKKDIISIQETIRKPIIIIMDECDVLGNSRVNLEKLRNIFMNIRGFMLVLTGTEALFPLIDDVFSPIIRQFKKINVGPFDKEEETRDCVRKPLQNLDIDPYEILDRETLFDIPAIHDLSGGRPYEIQLLCHHLFRGVQQGRVSKMTITSDILDEVLDTLQSPNDKHARPIISKIRSLEKDQLFALGILCYSNGKATFEQEWFIEYLINGTTRWTQDALSDNLQYFRKIGLVTVNEFGIISFTGDDFDRIYSKYFAKKHGVAQKITDRLPEENAGFDMVTALSEKLGVPLSMFLKHTDVSGTEIQDMVSLFHMEDDEDVKSLKNPFDIHPTLAFRFYIDCFEYLGNSSYPLIYISLTSPWYKVKNLLTPEFSKEVDQSTTYKEKLDEAIQELRDRAISLDGDIEHEIFFLPVLSPETLSEKLSHSKNDTMKENAFLFHYNKMLDKYYDDHDKELALIHGEAALKYRNPETGMQANNLGYLYMSFNRLDLAKSFIESSITILKSDPDIFLPKYNLSIIIAQQNMFKEALEALKEIKQEVEVTPRANDKCFCLFVPIIDSNGNLIYEEFFDIYLLDAITRAVSAFESLSSQG